MYIDPELRDRVYQLFSLEVPKMLQSIETELVNLSVARSEQTVNNLLRAAHSIKGGAASLGLVAIADLAHQAEDIFRVLNHPELPFDRHLDRLLFDLYDCLDRLVSAEIHGESLEAGFHTRTQILLAALDDEIGHFVIVGRDLHPDLTDGIDLTQSIFEIDVAQSLERLERVLLDSHRANIVVGEFRAQAEVFTGIADLTNIPKFGNLARSTIDALDRQPERAREICCFALVDFYRALNAVLTGDRHNCGEISPGFAFLLAEGADRPNRTIYWRLASPTDEISHLDNPAGNFADDIAVLEELSDEQLSIDTENRELTSLEFVMPQPAPDFSEVVVADEDCYRLAREISLATRGEAAEFDFVIEDILLSTVIVVDPLDFDLLEMFDLDRDGNWRAIDADARELALDNVDPLTFDLLEIFDSVSDRLWIEPQRECVLRSTANEDPLAFDLLEMFEPARPSVRSPLELRSEVATLTADFERLAPLDPDTFILPKPPKPPRAKKSRQLSQSPVSQLSVRVALDRLDRMNNLMGELAIERHGLAIGSEQLMETLARLRAKCESFHNLANRLGQIADNLAIATQLRNPHTEFSHLLAEDFNAQFDLLELDRYTEVHHVAQATIEQLIQIEEQIDDLSLFAIQSNRQIDRQKQLLSHLRDDLMWSRMLPLGEILNRFPRTIHDLSIEFNKPVDLKITGVGVLVDRAAMDKLFDPLIHLLRNAFDHGIDPPAVRLAAGKPERGTISINAYHQGSHTIIEIADDGRGIDLQAIATKAVEIELLTPAAAAKVSKEQLLDLMFAPGFSTAERVTKLSGRGMGLDIVKEQIQSIKGTIEIDTQAGVGTTFTLRIPLTLTIAQLMVCQVGNAVYAFPADSIYTISIPTADRISMVGDRRSFKWRNSSVPIYNLAELLTYTIPVPERPLSQTLKSSANNPPDWLPPLLLIRIGERFVALEVDRLIAEQELTIVPFGKSISPPSYSYGCTILGDGVILPVLDPHRMIHVLVDRPRVSIVPIYPVAPVPSLSSILVVDDSVTTRQSLCLSLEKYGYRTLQARDGQEALQIMRQKTSEIQLVICDVEMPNMNGFEFLNIRRQDPSLTSIPVVMLTSRSNSKHRQFAAHLGALDYFIKPYIEQDFMDAIGKLIINF